MLRLRRAEIVTSTRGARGGYVLARPAKSISVREVIAGSELATFELHCVSNPVAEERCSSSQNCSIRPVWVMLQQKIDDVLESVNLADLLHDEKEVRKLVGLGRSPGEPTLPGVVTPSSTAGSEARERTRLPVLQD